MTLRIFPDRATRGGFAILEFDEDPPVEETVRLAVRNEFSGRWLGLSAPGPGGVVTIGDAHWQADPHLFGPYAVEPQTRGARVRIGPEIVNKLEDDIQVRLVIGAQSWPAIWPGEVLPRQGPALAGQIEGIGRPSGKGESERLLALGGRPPDADPGPPVTADEPRPQAPEPEPEPETVPEAKLRRRWLPLILLIPLAAVVIGLALWFFADWPQAAAVPAAPVAPAVTAAPPPEPSADCTFAALAAAGQDHPGRMRALASCGPQAGADAALRLVELGASEGDGAALLEMAALYDPAAEGILTRMFGLEVVDTPAIAADYLARAVGLGTPGAASRLVEICARLSARGDTLSREAHREHCP